MEMQPIQALISEDARGFSIGELCITTSCNLHCRPAQAMMLRMNHWLVKQEPTAYSWDDFVADGGTAWTGVRNFQARNNLKAMRKGDRVLFYHSVEAKAVVGIATVETEAYPDPTATDGNWVCVDLVPLKPLKNPVTLARIKTSEPLASITLIKHSRLSVMPLTSGEFGEILKLSS